MELRPNVAGARGDGTLAPALSFVHSSSSYLRYLFVDGFLEGDPKSMNNHFFVITLSYNI
jgi:hypothetical protein